MTPVNDTERSPRLSGGGEKPLRADARRNRERVLEAAREAFADEGQAVPLDEIARRAGVGPGTVYRHFPTKKALFEAVILGRVQLLADEARALATADDPGGAFFGFLSQMVREGALKRDLIEALAGEGIEVEVGESDVARDLRAAIGDLLSRAQEVAAVRSDVGTAELIPLLTGASFAIRHHGADGPQAERMLAVVYDGLRT